MKKRLLLVLCFLSAVHLSACGTGTTYLQWWETKGLIASAVRVSDELWDEDGNPYFEFRLVEIYQDNSVEGTLLPGDIIRDMGINEHVVSAGLEDKPVLLFSEAEDNASPYIYLYPVPEHNSYLAYYGEYQALLRIRDQAVKQKMLVDWLFQKLDDPATRAITIEELKYNDRFICFQIDDPSGPLFLDISQRERLIAILDALENPRESFDIYLRAGAPPWRIALFIYQGMTEYASSFKAGETFPQSFLNVVRALSVAADAMVTGIELKMERGNAAMSEYPGGEVNGQEREDLQAEFLDFTDEYQQLTRLMGDLAEAGTRAQATSSAH